MVYAQIAMISSYLLPLDVIRSLTTSMLSFLSTANPSDITEYEEDQVCVWATLLPYIKLFYLPRASSRRPDLCSSTLTTSGSQSDNCSQNESAEMRHPVCIDSRCTLAQDNSSKHDQARTVLKSASPPPPIKVARSNSPRAARDEKWLPCDGPEEARRGQAVKSLKQASLSMALFFLHTKIARECHCKVLLEEGLVDFVTCLPWHMAAASQERAGQVVWELNSHLKLQPPRLFNLAGAVLAREHFGLEKVVRLHSPMELAREILDSRQ